MAFDLDECQVDEGDPPFFVRLEELADFKKDSFLYLFFVAGKDFLPAVFVLFRLFFDSVIRLCLFAFFLSKVFSALILLCSALE